MKYSYPIEVRGYELDSFGHVNNAIYLNYYEQARWVIMQEIGMLAYFKETEGFLVVVKAEIKYIRELNLLDKALVNTYYYTAGFFVIFKQEIRNDRDEKVNEATIKCVLVDKNKQALDLPQELMKGMDNGTS